MSVVGDGVSGDVDAGQELYGQRAGPGVRGFRRARGTLYDIYAHGVSEHDLCGQWGNTSGGTVSSRNNVHDIYAHGGVDRDLHGLRSGASYGNNFGPSAGRTWAAEAVMLASLRQALGEERDRATPMGMGLSAPGQRRGMETSGQPVLRDTARPQGGEGRKKRAEDPTRAAGGREESRLERAKGHKVASAGAGAGACEGEAGLVVAAGSTRARPELRADDELALCRRLARALMLPVRVVVALPDSGQDMHHFLSLPPPLFLSLSLSLSLSLHTLGHA